MTLVGTARSPITMSEAVSVPPAKLTGQSHSETWPHGHELGKLGLLEGDWCADLRRSGVGILVAP
ncbi:hypothetical protein GCM10010321_77260 [Streptomyces chartreusis]|nr:hypothetical protein GCM10010321_77260 [Streptomyces chartreusis]